MRPLSLLPAAFILVLASLGAVRQRGHVLALVTERDSLARSFRRYALARQTVISAGDSVPLARVFTAEGDTVTLRDLASAGTRYFYFYRDDCPACRTIAPLMTNVPENVRVRTAFIHLGYRVQRAPSGEQGHYAWVADSTGPRPIGSVPAFFIADDSGWVSASADFDARAVVNLLMLHKLIPRERLDSAVRAVRSTVLADGDAANRP